MRRIPVIVIPAKAGISSKGALPLPEMPAFAGMMDVGGGGA